MTTTGFETYATLDYLGRCGVAFACLCTDLMPTGKRGSISSIHPSGWKQQMYDFVDGQAVYNRCHLIGWQLSGENANERNLITGTRYLNTKGMLPFENMVSDYIKETHNHVLYRITPIFDGDNLVASGVQMEAYSVEDDGDGICFNVYCYNVQPGVWIDYKTGENHAEDTVTEAPKTVKKAVAKTTAKKTTLAPVDTKDATYVGNRNTKKFHKPSCASVKQMKESNRVFFYCQREEVVSQGYVPCKNCNP
ncbi:MAG: DNA/RNA non-specific endonuclease [Clostridia bacterium]|nr:DNA/RNA non-specific endonuclease [Clostridia bacterium]